ncbi:MULTISPECIES: GreA/GreB family elongation factor [Geothrix]|uniref:GreA/GreB family elongation factor n=1 Tax=Geothrix TaxID=44675 RepID=UPI001FACC884|nr:MULTISPECIES: GreA/GreB family elongation factor [Geothrix]HJV37474.1 GreA/GreB family elongation factor [Geothrix sp.]
MPKHVLAKLEQELKTVKQALLVDIPQEIARAAGQGDLSENAEYEQALAKRDMFQNKLVTLEKRISEVASLDISRLPKTRAAYGSKVTILDLDSEEEFTFKLVLPEELDGHPQHLSISSPIGMALVGQEEGNEVRVQIPAGVRRFEILELKTIHDVA